MEKRLKVAEFATLVGIVPKTVYKMIDRKEILTVTEKVNNRNITLIITSDEQIAELRKNFSKDTVNVGNYYENVTENYHSQKDTYGYETVKDNYNNNFNAEVIDRIISLSESYNEQLREVNDELIRVKSQQLLLEDKAGREGLYLAEITQLKNSNNELGNSNKRLLKWLLTVIVFLVITIISLIAIIFYNKALNNIKPNVTAPVEVHEPVIIPQEPVKKVYKKNIKKEGVTVNKVTPQQE